MPNTNGTTSVRTVGIDITENATFGPTFSIRRDGTPPLIAFGGDAFDHRTDGSLGYNPLLKVSVTDGNAAFHQSGVQTVAVTLDGVRIKAYTNTNAGCDADCSYYEEITLPITTPGTHTLQASAIDRAGNIIPTSAYTLQIRSIPGPIDQYDEAVAMGAQLATRPDYWTLWAALTEDERNYMLAGIDDPDMASWARRIDTTPPPAPHDLDVQYYNASTRMATVFWSESEDPDLSTTLSGSMTQEGKASYRFKRADGDWSSWRSTSDARFDLGSLNPGDVLSVQVSDFDRAGNQSAALSDTVTIPAGPKAKESIAIAFPVLACVEWCPLVVASVGAVSSGAVWTVDDKGFAAKHYASQRSVVVTRMDDDQLPFEDWEAKKQRERANLGKHGEAIEAPAERSKVSPHHVVAVGDGRASFARWIIWKCGLDPNNWMDNGVWIPRKSHQKMHTTAYYEAINDMLKKYHPTFGSDPCGEDSGGIDLESNGLRRAMQDIKRYVKANYVPR